MRVVQIGLVLAIVFLALGRVSGADSADPTLPMDRSEELIAIASVNEATVRVVARTCDGTIRGSGFVAEGQLFTNKHLTVGAPELKVDQDGGPVLRPILRRSAEIDAAVVTPIDVREMRFSTVDAVALEPVMFAGHAGGGGLVVSPATVQLETDGAAYGIKGRVLLLDAETVGGFSGGPVVNRRGEVVAMLQGFDTATGLSLAIPTMSLIEWRDSGQDSGDVTCG